MVLNKAVPSGKGGEPKCEESNAERREAARPAFLQDTCTGLWDGRQERAGLMGEQLAGPGGARLHPRQLLPQAGKGGSPAAWEAFQRSLSQLIILLIRCRRVFTKRREFALCKQATFAAGIALQRFQRKRAAPGEAPFPPALETPLRRRKALDSLPCRSFSEAALGEGHAHLHFKVVK